MNLYLPDNFFSRILELQLPKSINAHYRTSSMISKELERNTSSIALIPSLDLLKNRTLFVSSKLAISFDDILSHSYFYPVEGKRKLDRILLHGDVSLNELVLSKLIISERYSEQIEIVLDTKPEMVSKESYILCGKKNFETSIFEKGISLADVISEMLDLPYVNYVFASPDKEALATFQDSFENIDNKVEEAIESIAVKLNYNVQASQFISSNIGSLYFEMTDNEQDGLNELIKLVFYHGIVEDMFEVKYL